MNIFDILKKVNVHSLDNGKRFVCDTRREAISNILENSNFNILTKDGFLMIYKNFTNVDLNDYVLISCHVDTVFDEKDYFVRELYGDKVLGTFDNSGSIAVLLKAMKIRSLNQVCWFLSQGMKKGE